MNPIRTIVAVSGVALTVLTLAVVPAQAAPPPAPPTRSELQSLADAIVDAGAPGVSVGVSDELGMWNGVAGVGNEVTGSAPDPDGWFRTGSITKSFTATMVLQLFAEGDVELDAPIDEYLPDLLPYEEDITVRELLQHQSGLFNYADELWPDPQTASERRFLSYTPSELVQVATEQPLQFTPGEEFAYSDTNYIVLGMLIEEVTDSSIATELKHRILRPAGLRHTYLAGAFPFLPHPALRGYEALGEPDGALTDFTVFNMTVAWTTGAIVSTSDDVNRFYEALVTGKLLPATQLREMQQTVPAFEGFGYGLGLAGGEACGQPIWGHVGGTAGYSSYSFTSADGERQISITVNRSLTADRAVHEAITAMLMTEFCGSPPDA